MIHCLAYAGETLPRENGSHLDIRVSPTVHDQVRAYAARYGMGISAAARHLLTEQLRYWTWQEDRRRRGPSPDDLRSIGRSIVRDHPEVTKNALRWHMAERVGRFADVRLIRRIADEFFEKR